MNAAYEQSPRKKAKRENADAFFAFLYPEAAVRDLVCVFSHGLFHDPTQPDRDEFASSGTRILHLPT